MNVCTRLGMLVSIVLPLLLSSSSIRNLALPRDLAHTEIYDMYSE
jgi:hypothetical protein